MKHLYLIFLGAAFAGWAAGQDSSQTQHTTVPFRDPAASHKLEVNLFMANITVQGTGRTDVAIDYASRGPVRTHPAAEPPPPGMHRLGGSGLLEVSQENNVMRVSGGGPMAGAADLTIQVPAQTSVTISAALGGKITVENIAGEIEVNNLNGEITISNASGPVVAHSMNGKIIASLSKVAAGKSMSFSNFNGDVDVTLPADSKATLKARADNGDIFTDFDVKIDTQSQRINVRPAASPAPPVPPAPPLPPLPPSGSRTAADQIREQVRRAEEVAREAARRASRSARDLAHNNLGEGYVEGTINGGGTEIQFTTFNGRVLIHKK